MMMLLIFLSISNRLLRLLTLGVVRLKMNGLIFTSPQVEVMKMLDFISSYFREVFSFSIFGISLGDVCLAVLLFMCFLLILAFPFVFLLGGRSK